MLYWIYDLPLWQAEALFVSFFVGFTWLGLIFIRPFLRLWLRKQPGVNDIVGYFLSLFSVIYGLLLGLLAVATYQNLSDVEKTLVQESSSLAALYRDVSSYPEPHRKELQDLLREYTRYVIEDAWPLQQKGIIPSGGTEVIDRFQAKVNTFEPQTKGQEILHAEALRQFNNLIEKRRARLYQVNAGIPTILWYTVGIGAMINILLIWMFELKFTAMVLLGGLVMFFTATMICLVALMDNPYRGTISVTPESFQMVYDSLMKK